MKSRIPRSGEILKTFFRGCILPEKSNSAESESVILRSVILGGMTFKRLILLFYADFTAGKIKHI